MSFIRADMPLRKYQYTFGSQFDQNYIYLRLFCCNFFNFLLFVMKNMTCASQAMSSEMHITSISNIIKICSAA